MSRHASRARTCPCLWLTVLILLSGPLASAASDASIPTVQAMLKVPLSVEDTVRIAMVRNPDMRALYEEIGIAQADVVAAGLLKNPVFEGFDRFPNAGASAGHPLVANTNVAVSVDVLDLLLRSTRKKLAETEYQQTRLRVADMVTRLTFDVKSAAYTLQEKLQAFATQKDIAEAAEAAAGLARRQLAAGNVSPLDVEREEAAASTAHLDLVRFELDVALARQSLSRLMGITPEDGDLTLQPSLPALVAAEPSVAELDKMALANRPDLEVARLDLERLDRQKSLARQSALGTVMLGVSSEYDAQAYRVTGPTLSFGIPLFDHNQAIVRGLDAQLRRARYRLEATVLDVRSSVRADLARVQSERAIFEYYRDVVLPQRRRILAASLERYNAMLLGVYTLLQTRQEEITANREALETLRDYWIARASLERTVGGRLPDSMEEKK